MLLSNARNVVRVEDGIVVKRSADLAGELFFYRELALRVPRLRRLFPRLLPGSSTALLELELVPATPLTHVFAGLRMRPRHLSAVFVALGELHAVGEAEVALTTSPAAAKRFLAEKTAARFAAPAFAGLRDARLASCGCSWRGSRRTSRRASASCTATRGSRISCSKKEVATMTTRLQSVRRPQLRLRRCSRRRRRPACSASTTCAAASAAS